MTTIVEERELTLNDRCDSCQAAAKVVATFISGELLFCGHHARENKDSLTSKSIKVYDPEGLFDLVQ
jgi:hypothetical protein